MKKKLPTFQCEVISLEEFRQRVLDQLVEHYQTYNPKEMLLFLIEWGFPKFDHEDLGKFTKGLAGSIYLPSVMVDFGDSMFYWFISGSDAILVRKPT